MENSMRRVVHLSLLLALLLLWVACGGTEPGPSVGPSTEDPGRDANGSGEIGIDVTEDRDVTRVDSNGSFDQGEDATDLAATDVEEDRDETAPDEADLAADTTTPEDGDTGGDSVTPDASDASSDPTSIDITDTTSDPDTAELVETDHGGDAVGDSTSDSSDSTLSDSVGADVLDAAEVTDTEDAQLDLREEVPDLPPDAAGEDVAVETARVAIETVPDPALAQLPQTVVVRVAEPIEGESVELALAAPSTGVLMGKTTANVHGDQAVFDMIGFTEQGTYDLVAQRGIEESESVNVVVLSHPRDTDFNGELSRAELEGGYLSCGVSSGDEGCPTVSGVSIPYRLFVPDHADLTSLPLVLYLHGAGKRGADNYRQLQQDGAVVWAELEHQFDHPVFVVAPQCPRYRRWSDMCDPPGECFATDDVQFQPVRQEMVDALAILDAVIAHYEVDTDRIYMTGGSMGGYGTWDALLRRPGLFAAAIPVAGGVDPDYADQLLDVGLWVSHGDADPAVLFSASGSAVEAIETLGGRPRFTRFEGRAHDIWADAWWPPLLGRGPGAGRDLIEWTYAHSRGDASAPTAPAELAGEFDSDGGSVDLSWEAAVDDESGISQYVIMRDGVHIGTTRDQGFRDDGSATYAEHPLEVGEHEYVVHAMNGSVVVGPASNLVTVEVTE